MDTSSFRRLIALAGVLLCLSCGLLPVPARAAWDPNTGSWTTKEEAYNACMAGKASKEAATGKPYVCTDKPDAVVASKYSASGYYCTAPSTSPSSCSGYYYYRVPKPTDPQICSSRPSYSGILGANLAVCKQGCMYKPTNPLDGMDGGLKTCVAGVGGACASHSTYKPTGATCDGGPAGDTTPPPAPPAIPKLCGGGSCYDPNTGKGCALDANGNQVCIDVKPGTPGGCASSGETTLCGGNPPPTPPADKVPDPPGDITGSDKITQQPIDGSGNGGNVSNTTINNYNNGTSGGDRTPNNGGTAGDSGTPSGGDPAPSTSTAGPSSTFGGGGDCATPPVCTGDAATCGIARLEWKNGCDASNHASKADAFMDKLDKLLADDPTQDPDTLAAHMAGDAWSSSTGTGNAIADAANAGHYDETGFGFGTACPLHDLDVPLWDGKVLTISMSKGCEVGEWLRAIILAFATFAAVRITAGGRE